MLPQINSNQFTYDKDSRTFKALFLDLGSSFEMVSEKTGSVAIFKVKVAIFKNHQDCLKQQRIVSVGELDHLPIGELISLKYTL